MILTYGSVCSGIEAASVAWEVLGHQPAWFAEIEKFPSAVLAHHWPDVQNLGDMTKIAAAILAGDVQAPDVLVGGTPCQGFSLAGLRGGLSDPRGQLTLAFVELANAIDIKRAEEGKPPCIVLWENVPGVLSMPDNAFGNFISGLAGADEAIEPGQRPEPGKNGKFWRWQKSTREHVAKWAYAGGAYGRQRAVGWRLLDAQYFGVAQRRRRVFVVASARQGFDPVQILAEFDGVRRDTPPSRSKEQVTSSLTANGVGVRGADDRQAQAGHLQVVGTLAAHSFTGGAGGRPEGACAGHFIPVLTGSHWDDPNNPHPTLNQSHNTGGIGGSNQEVFAQRGSGIVPICMAHGQSGAEISTDDSAPTLTCNHEAPIVTHGFNNTGHGFWSEGEAASTIRAGNADGGGGARESTLITFPAQMSGTQFHAADGEVCQTLQALNPTAVAYAVALRGREGGTTAELGDEVSGALRSAEGGGCKSFVLTDRLMVRRLMPIECERLQGFPDGHTLVPYAKKPAKDGPRYKAIGNSMAVPVMRWIMRRITAHLESIAPVEPPAPQVVETEHFKMTVYPGGVGSLTLKKKPIDSITIDTSSIPASAPRAASKRKTMPKKQKVIEPSFVRPFLKWPGGKYSVLDQIMPHIGTGKRLIEPFVGSGVISMNAPDFERYLLADTNRDLISLFVGVGVANITDTARLMFKDNNSEEGFLSLRAKFNENKMGMTERAAAFLYLNRHAFNGLMRYNLAGAFNTSYGKYKAPYFPEDELKAFAELYAKCELKCQSFVTTIREARAGDVVFCDPPYMPMPDTEGFTSYTKDPFKDEHHWSLLNEMVQAHQRGARVVVTNSGAPAIREAYEKAGFKIYPLFARRSMSCKGKGRGIVADIIGVLS